MKMFAATCFAVVLLSQAALTLAQESPQLPTPEKEHAWLEQLVGEWEAEGEVVMEPGKPPVKYQATEKVRSIGGFWVMAETQSSMMGMQVTGIMTLGYDPKSKNYVGTWVDSCQNHLWKYEGSVTAEGTKLTLNTEGPSMTSPGAIAKYQETIELKGKDRKIFSSSIQTEDGKFHTFMTIDYRRKK